MRVRWSTDAADDLEEIANYLHEYKPELAQLTIVYLYRELMKLRSYPLVGRPMDRPGYRELVVNPLPYLCTYRVDDDAVYIIRIRHTSREPLASIH